MKILKSLFVIALAVSVMVGTTAAFFSDVGTSTGNTFTAGTLDLKLNGADGVTATWGIPSMSPGDSVSGSIVLRNVGTLNADHIEINPIVNTTTDFNGDNAGFEIDRRLQVTAATYTDESGTPDDLLASPGKLLVDVNGNGWIDLDDLESAAVEGGVLDNLPAPSAGGPGTTLSMTIKFRTDTGNKYQGDSDVMNLTFTLNQDASQ